VGRRMRYFAAALAVALLGVAVVPGVAQASSGASGVVAVHNGSWGYQELVFGKATTAQLADAAPIQILNSAAGKVGIWVLPLGVYAWTIQLRARQAENSGQCFALVRPGWYLPLYFAAQESWGC